jgi:NADH:ubiquinone oxidoreductase subunit 2 (subunit N)
MWDIFGCCLLWKFRRIASCHCLFSDIHDNDNHNFAVILSPLRRSLLDGVERIKYTTDFAMLGKINPLLATALTLSMFSLAGIPPLAGFMESLSILAALSSSQYLLAFVGIATSAISCFIIFGL